jgi:hypothetical protein
MCVLDGKSIRYALDGHANVAGFFFKKSGHEYVKKPGALWKMMLSRGTEVEIPVFSGDQKPEIRSDGRSITVHYGSLLVSGKAENITLDVMLSLEDDRLAATSSITNDSDFQVMEISLTAASGIESVTGESGKEAIAWPKLMGMRIPDPAHSDLSVYSGFRKYERHDQFHTDLDALYPSRMSMQWYDLYGNDEGLYVGCHDTTHHTVCMHVERDVREDILRMGVCRYPMLEKGESWTSQPTVYQPHLGDWHAGAKIYRSFMVESLMWEAPCQPQWAKDFAGWLRIIFQPQYGVPNFTFRDIPRLYDQAEKAGMKVLYIMGWEDGGFARRWPDYAVSEDLGGEKLLREGIDYIHRKGGKAFLFLSYSLIDHKSDFYLEGPGKRCTMKDAWGEEIPFAETYSGEGTYRKLTNPPMPMYLSCPGSDEWQEKMLSSADLCLDLGSDGVLYDLGGLPAYFCFDKSHGHGKPSHSMERKAERFKELHDHIHGRNEEAIIMMEHTVDVFNQHIDIVQATNHLDGKNEMAEMYRYTFPELIETNREMGQDECGYKKNCGLTFLYGLRFDMTIYRCCGTLEDIPHYAEYLTRINRIRQEHRKTLLEGRFVDEEGFSIDDREVRAKGYQGGNGSFAVTLWNPTKEEKQVTVTFADGKKKKCVVEAEGIALAEEERHD